LRLTAVDYAKFMIGVIDPKPGDLINLEYVTATEPYDAARLQVVMRSGARIVATRAGSKRLRELAL
jgi:hypothetical protein